MLEGQEQAYKVHFKLFLKKIKQKCSKQEINPTFYVLQPPLNIIVMKSDDQKLAFTAMQLVSYSNVDDRERKLKTCQIQIVTSLSSLKSFRQAQTVLTLLILHASLFSTPFGSCISLKIKRKMQIKNKFREILNTKKTAIRKQ